MCVMRAFCGSAERLTLMVGTEANVPVAEGCGDASGVLLGRMTDGFGVAVGCCAEAVMRAGEGGLRAVPVSSR